MKGGTSSLQPFLGQQSRLVQLRSLVIMLRCTAELHTVQPHNAPNDCGTRQLGRILTVRSDGALRQGDSVGGEETKERFRNARTTT